MQVQALALAKERALAVTVELKGSNTEEAAIAVVRELGMQDKVIFSSFNHSRVARAKVVLHIFEL